MSNLLHVCLYDTDPEGSFEVSKPIRDLKFVRLVGEVSAPDKLAELLRKENVNVVFFHLDPNPDPVVNVIEQVTATFPELALIAISGQTDPSAILAPMRAGCDQFVCKPIDPSDLAAAVNRVASKRFFHPKSRCICVTPASGGAGATSIACNLALEIAQSTERECALIDLDLQFGDVAMNFDCHPKYTFFDLASVGDELDKSALDSALKKLSCNVALLARPQTIEQHDGATADTTQRILDLLGTDYENVVLDVPRLVAGHTHTAFSRAELILLVCQLSVPSIHNTKRYYETLINMGILEDRIEIVLNRGDARSQSVSQNDIMETLEKEVFWTIPNDYEFVSRSVDLGRPIAALDRNNAVRSAIREMAKKITSSTEAAERGQGRRGLISRFLSR